MRRPGRASVAVATACLLAGCSAEPQSGGAEGFAPGGPASASTDPSAPTSASPSESPEESRASPRAGPDRPPDPRWRFFVADRTRYASPWFPGRHRVMIGYGCTDAPYYVPDARCGGRGFHHGVDVAIPCGTPLLSGVRGRVVRPSPGTVGPAYGERPLLLRAPVAGGPADILLGHGRRVLVQPGDRVRPGQRVAVTGASGAPDGCHLHLEVRSPGGGVDTARDPGPVLQLR